MKKFAALFLLAFLFTISCSAQTATVSGKVQDADEDKPIGNAVVALFTPKDSILFSFTRTDTAGNYLLKNVTPGKYIMMTSHPYHADLLEDIQVNNDTKLPVTSLVSKSKLLQEVIVKSGAPFHIKGDTTVYTADSFKVGPNANVEELLKKLPGIQVDKDGQIKAMGQTVQKVLVDGEEFFGDDPGMAVKNLRADAVKEVQVYDKKSDQAEFTGIDDGKTQKTINLKLKDSKKTGYFGKADVSAGPQKHIANRYNDNLMFSSFKGKRKLSAFFLNGNTGQDGLNWQDQQKYSSEDDISLDVSDDGNINFTWTGNSDDEPNVDTRNGYITNVNAGVQYSNKWNDQYNLNFSPKYNSQQYLNHQTRFTQSQIGDSVLNTNSNENMDVNRYNFLLRGIVDIKLDSANSLKVTGNSNLYHTESTDFLNSETTGNIGTLKNTSDRQLQTKNDKNALSGNFIFKHKFRKSRRTLSFTGNWYCLDNQGTNFLKSANQAYSDGAPSGTLDLDQRKDYEQSTENISTGVVYTEPLNKTISLLLGYQLAYNYGTNNQLTYNYSSASGKYDYIVDSLSNNFKQNILQNIPSVKINFSNKKWKVNMGSGFGFTHFDLQDITFNKDYVRNYTNFYPSAVATYTYKPNHDIRLYYNGNTVQPTVEQLQPLRNNNDYFNQVIGNPNLKPSFRHSLYLSHQNYNFLNDIYTYQSFNANVEQNSITTNSIINLDSGKTVSQAVNVNGNYSFGFYGGVGFKVKKINTRLSFGPSFQFNRYAQIINSQKSYSKTFAPGFSTYINTSKEKKYDLTLSDEINYNNSTTSQNQNRIHYYANTLSFYATIYYKKVWSLITDYQFSFRQKTFPSDIDLNTHIWNAQLQRTLRHDEFTFYFKVRDILNQNIGIDRSFYGNTFTEQTNYRLKRYFMLGFTWNFKNK